ncbi:hypothetical protein M422DRAFT_52148 [Sphaerobolus stellatus SS14]|uniref:DUF6593 domain-containing protein n=1 Tax=Sphaerobolus stellatus (strain SS14) TaxID=990650 RepID=A0A0C9UH43_SPHS4|nr:hypothetical protein M422DRAFT_52148 [Sphaerobolus stellatus SS14]
MNITLHSDDPLNTIISNSSNGAPMYHTETHKVVDKTTHLKKFTPGTQGSQDLAEIHWETMTFHSPKLLYRGQQLRVSEFLVKDGIFKSYRTFFASDGNQYTWKCDSLQKFTLLDSSKNVIVESHKDHAGIFHKAQNYNIDVMSAGLSILDDIIVSFIIVRHLEMKKRTDETNVVVTGAIINS